MTAMSELAEIDPVALSPKKASALLDVGLTQLYQLLGSREIESFRVGKSRKVLVASLNAYVARQLAAEVTKQRPEWTTRATEARIAKRTGLPPRRRTRRNS